MAMAGSPVTTIKAQSLPSSVTSPARTPFFGVFKDTQTTPQQLAWMSSGQVHQWQHTPVAITRNSPGGTVNPGSGSSGTGTGFTG
jgi:hypothetical protein